MDSTQSQSPILESVKINNSFFDKIKEHLPLILGVVLLILIMITAGLYFRQQQQPKKQPVIFPTPPISNQKVQISTESAHLATITTNQPIAKVGEEIIYKKDLDTELAYFPAAAPVDTNKFLLDKIINDSIILQGAKADGYISLDKIVFNSLNKDYLKRIKLVETAKQKITNQADGIEGNFVSIWFFNTKPGAVGYEEGKKIAYDKISKLWESVKNKTITIEQAGEQIKNDTSLAQVDTAYKSNAIGKFTALKNGQPITFDPTFNDALWKLKTGEVSDLFLVQDQDYKTKQKIDAVYIFGQVDKINSSGKVVSLDDWLTQKRRVYAISTY